MQAHFSHQINHGQTILNQINDGMYAKWFEDKENLTVIDFGANVGLTALYFLPACKELHCVEPTPAHMELCKELIEANKTNQLVAYLPEALSNDYGEVIFMTGHSTENKITSLDGYGNGKITVVCKPLSHYVNQCTGPVDFCKVDIEGAEILALTLEEIQKIAGKVKTFFVEVHPAYNGGMDENKAELMRRFETAGYKTDTIDYQTFTAEWLT
jgi:FkbM family methyltransferase